MYELSRSSWFDCHPDSHIRTSVVLDLLKEGPKTTGQLCQQFEGLNRCTVMQHLGILEAADLVVVKREGRCRWNYLNAMPIKDIHERWIGEYAVAAVALLARMEESLRKSA